MEWQPLVTLIAAVLAAGTSGFTLLKLQGKKRNDDLDIKAFDHSLNKRFKEFEQKLIEDNSYLAEKGKNTATKEDIEEVTRKIESIKNEFTTPIEFLRLQLSKRANLHKLQAEKEFEVYAKLWNIITELRFAFEDLRPLLNDIQPSGTDFSELHKKTYKVFKDCRNQLLKEVEKQRPFYSETLYIDLRKLLQTTTEEMFSFEAATRIDEPYSEESKNAGKENLDKFTENLNKVCDSIRDRIIES